MMHPRYGRKGVAKATYCNGLQMPFNADTLNLYFRVRVYNSKGIVEGEGQGC